MSGVRHVVLRYLRALRKRLKTSCSCRLYRLTFLCSIAVGLYVFRGQSGVNVELATLDDLYYTANRYGHAQNASTARILRSVIRLHCVILRNGTNSSDVQASEAYMSWTPGCNSVSAPNISTNSSTVWKAVRQTFASNWRRADWFLFVDPGTFVIPENVRLFLVPFMNSYHKPLVIGSRTNDGRLLGCVLVSAGFLRRLITSGVSENPACYAERQILPVKCLSNLNAILIDDTRDQYGRHRILPLQPHFLLNASFNPKMYEVTNRLLYPISAGPGCCSTTAFAIMNVHWLYVTMIHYWISIAHTIGTEVDYSRMTLREKMASAMETAMEGLPPTVRYN
ncbi:hypothetical protein Q1695_013816 [Nippostrongylus brasiliensis]|nr:hypothetical protein Q1695_013816 [Nippostrongylus brasiliensis]